MVCCISVICRERENERMKERKFGYICLQHAHVLHLTLHPCFWWLYKPYVAYWHSHLSTSKKWLLPHTRMANSMAIMNQTSISFNWLVFGANSHFQSILLVVIPNVFKCQLFKCQLWYAHRILCWCHAIGIAVLCWLYHWLKIHPIIADTREKPSRITAIVSWWFFCRVGDEDLLRIASKSLLKPMKKMWNLF